MMEPSLGAGEVQAFPRTADDSARVLAHVAAIRTALQGFSVVDSARVWFPDRAAVDAFLRLHAFDTDNPIDLRRLGDLHHEATVYLADTQRYRLPRDVEQPESIHDLFLHASHGPRRLQKFACMALKTMHILHHIAGHELVFKTPMSEADLLSRLNTKVFAAIDAMRASGVSVQEYATGKKTRTSMVTKLLAKKDSLVTHVFDKLRFRVITQTRDDLVFAMLYLVRHLVPFNYVVPGESQNGVITREDVVRVLGITSESLDEVWGADSVPGPTPRNEFSGRSFRCINFVADIPIRIDDFASVPPPAIAFVQAEIQLVDVATNEANEHGDNAHPVYKKRQRERVRRRLEGPIALDGGEGPPELL